MPPIETINYFVALASLLLQIVTVAFLVLFFVRKKFTDLEGIAVFLEKWGLWFAFLFTVSGVISSLFYSEVLSILPCGLCWLQRMFLYPQVLLFALALWKKDTRVADYSIALSVFGGVIALYQHYLQMGGASVLPCPATAPQAVDCGVRFLFEFGYVTFPLISFTLFAFLIVLMLFVRNRNAS